MVDHEETQAWQVGAVRITAVVEAQTDGIPVEFFLPKADAAQVQAVD